MRMKQHCTLVGFWYLGDVYMLTFFKTLLSISYMFEILKNDHQTSGQDGGMGKHGLPCCTTTSKLQLKYRTTITQECQKLS